MTIEESKNALNAVKQTIDDLVFDIDKKIHYCNAIDTAILGLDNYERLLDQTISEYKIKILNIEHDIALRNLRFQIFKEGGNLS